MIISKLASVQRVLFAFLLGLGSKINMLHFSLRKKTPNNDDNVPDDFNDDDDGAGAMRMTEHRVPKTGSRQASIACMYCKLPEQLGMNGSSAFDFAAKRTKLRRKMSYSRNRFSLASFFSPRSWRLNRHFCLPLTTKPKIKVSRGLRILYFAAQCIQDPKRVGLIKAIHFVSG